MEMPKIIPHLTIMSPDGTKSDDAMVKYIQHYFDDVRGEMKNRIFVLGGDGLMNEAAERFPDSILIGIHRRRDSTSVGYLMNRFEGPNLQAIKDGRIRIVRCYFLEVELFDGDRSIAKKRAFNDFYFERADIANGCFSVHVNGKPVVEGIKCDGVITATVAGSTAYTANTGGLFLELKSLLSKNPDEQDQLSKMWFLTANNPPFNGTWHSQVLDPADTVVIQPIDTHFRKVRAVVDGRKITDLVVGDLRAEIKRSEKYVQLAFAETNHFCRCSR